MANIINTIYNQNLSLLTDLYQLTMASGYWKKGLYNRSAVFHLFYRKNPFKGDYAIACGLEMVIDYLQNLKFNPDDIQYLGTLKGADGYPLFEEGFLNYLQRFKFDCDIDAVAEGTLVFPHQPLIRVEGPLIQAQLIETALLNIINFQSLIATKSARICKAAEGDTILEFGLRRAQGIDRGISASRAAYIGGCHATSNVLAGKLFGIPVKGTHAHSWVMCFEEELEAFRAYAEAMPNNCIFLVDTYNTIEGVKKAIEIGLWLKTQGQQMLGIRLDSGDLANLSRQARRLLDQAGLTEAKVVASNDLDEYRIAELKRNGAAITVWGVGTRLATAYDQAALGGVYKLAAIKNEAGIWEDRIKLSEQAIKVSNPGIQQIGRAILNEMPVGDLIFEDNNALDAKTHLIDYNTEKEYILPTENIKLLLKPIFRNGQLVYQKPSIKDIRQHTLNELAYFDAVDLKTYPNGLEKSLYEKKMGLIDQARRGRLMA